MWCSSYGAFLHANFLCEASAAKYRSRQQLARNMMTPFFKQKVRQALNTHRPNSRNLGAFAIDVEVYLSQTDLFSNISSKKTAAPFCALIVRCTLADPNTSSAHVIATLEHVWLNASLGYNQDNDVYEFEHDATSVQMRFLTVASYGVVVTGRIEVTGCRL
jgi:hypothetical protein